MKAARIIVFGLSSFTRASIPDILADFENMPMVDDTAMPPDVRVDFLNNLEATRLFALEPAISIKEIRERTGVHPNQLYEPPRESWRPVGLSQATTVET